MNWKHIEAICKPCEMDIYFADVDGQRVLSDGHIAFAFNGEFPFGELRTREYQPLAALWSKHIPTVPLGAEMGDYAGAGPTIYRMVGGVAIAARFLRCFGEDSVYTINGKTNPVTVHRGGRLVGIVMPMKLHGYSPTIPEPTDEQIFSSFASEQNGWYLANRSERILEAEREIDNLRVAVETAEENLEEAEAELEDAERELASLKKLMVAA